MGAQRLIAVLLFLQQRGRVTAAEVAHEFEVSVPTARRDLDALAGAGVPLYATAGRGGGWQLVGGARTNLTGLTAEETAALFSLVGRVGTTAPEAARAVRKVRQALPSLFHETADRASEAVVVDDRPWGSAPSPAAPGSVPVAERALAQGRRLAFDYGRTKTRRVVDPLGVVDKSGLWYLITLAGEDTRIFRCDRISRIEMLDEPSTRPPGFDVRAAWRDAAARIEQRRGAVAAVVRAPRWVVQPLLGHFGAQATLLDDSEPGSAVVEVRAHTEQALVEQLAGWATTVRVESPGVRRGLADLGRELARRYAG